MVFHFVGMQTVNKIKFYMFKGCSNFRSTYFETTFTTCTLDKNSVKAHIRDRKQDGPSDWIEEYSDRLLEDLVTLEDNKIVSNFVIFIFKSKESTKITLNV